MGTCPVAVSRYHACGAKHVRGTSLVATQYLGDGVTNILKGLVVPRTVVVMRCRQLADCQRSPHGCDQFNVRHLRSHSCLSCAYTQGPHRVCVCHSPSGLAAVPQSSHFISCLLPLVRHGCSGSRSHTGWCRCSRGMVWFHNSPGITNAQRLTTWTRAVVVLRPVMPPPGVVLEHFLPA